MLIRALSILVHSSMLVWCWRLRFLRSLRKRQTCSQQHQDCENRPTRIRHLASKENDFSKWSNTPCEYRTCYSSNRLPSSLSNGQSVKWASSTGVLRLRGGAAEKP